MGKSSFQMAGEKLGLSKIGSRSIFLSRSEQRRRTLACKTEEGIKRVRRGKPREWFCYCRMKQEKDRQKLPPRRGGQEKRGREQSELNRHNKNGRVL